MILVLRLFLVTWTCIMLSSCTKKNQHVMPKDLEKLLFDANQDFLSRKFDTSLERVEKIIKKYPEYLPAQMLAGKIRFYTKKRKEAQDIFKSILSKEPGHQGALLWLARLAMSEKKTMSNAHDLLLHALNNNPEDFALHLEMANYYNKTGNMRQAMLEYQKALGMEGELLSAYGAYEAILVRHNLKDRAARIRKKRLGLEKIRNE